MISVDDLVMLDPSLDLVEAGIIHASRTLSRSPSARAGREYDAFRRAVAATAVELAFRRHLAERGVGFGVLMRAPFADGHEPMLQISGRRCSLKSVLISRPEQVEELDNNPGSALSAPALVPRDRFAGESLSDDDVYIFALVTGTTFHIHSPRSAASAATREYWLHIMPPAWARPRSWVSIAPLELRSDASEPIELELGGEDASRAYCDTRLSLTPRGHKNIDLALHSLLFLHAGGKPSGRISLTLPVAGRAHAIEVGDWQDVWIGLRRIFLLGWLPRGQFRARAQIIRAGSRVFQIDRTRTHNLAVEARSLRPIRRLLERAL